MLGDKAYKSLPNLQGQSGIGGGPYKIIKGNSQPHNNLQPYITVYMWKRVA